MPGWATRLLSDDSGQDLIEYALLTTFIALVSVVVFDWIRTAIATVYGTWNTETNNIWYPPDPAGGGS
jgi:Flp pilus assembly pilin Flp